MKLKKFTLIKKSGTKLEKMFDVEDKLLMDSVKKNGWVEEGAKPKPKAKKKKVAKKKK
tara:strand:- start:54 stop:227 length:174 start_codon:yes stop_codon:yes gene_type:complete